MGLAKVLPEEAGLIEGIVDTGIIVISRFNNPAKKAALNFLKDVLMWRRKCLIPVTTFLGAYHIMTRYLGVDDASAYRAITRTLKIRSPSLHEDISVESVIDSLTYALSYDIESWDGYIVCLAKRFRAPITYSVDKELARKVREIQVINPIPPEIFAQYNRWLSEKLKGT